MTKTKQKQAMDSLIHYRICGTVRLWRSEWFGDQFEVMDKAAFELFKKQAMALSFHFVFHEEDED